MKVLWVGDACVSSGFAKCTHQACRELVRQGHEVVVLGINYWGDPHEEPYKVYPSVCPYDGGKDQFGVTRLPRIIARERPDVVVLLNDPWNTPFYVDAVKEGLPRDFPRPKMVGFVAVDAKNQRGKPLNELDHVMVWTSFAEQELRAGGYDGNVSIVPLGVDGDVFYPVPGDQPRSIALPSGFPADAFVVGVVGRNQPRKRLDLTVRYFADWVKSYGIEDAYLYLHVGPTGDKGVDVRSLVLHYGLQGRVLVSEPHVGHGVDESTMRFVYSSFDVYFTTTQGEGWGLPALEAMACGVPVLAPDWSGLGDWAASAARLVPCTSTAMSAPLNGMAYTIGGVPDEAEMVIGLNRLYKRPELREDLRIKGLALAKKLTWHRYGQATVEALEMVHASPKRGVLTPADQHEVASSV